MPLSDLVLYLGNRALCGNLVVESRGIKKTFTLQKGAIVSTSSNDPREYLGQFLINFGHVSEEQLSVAFQTQSETNVMLGRILVMIGLISEENLREVLKVKYREMLLEALRWKEGYFQFDIKKLLDVDVLTIDVPVLEVIQEAEFRETAWEAMLQVFPSGRVTLKVDDSKISAVPPGSLDQKLFEYIRDGHTIDEICIKLHATDFHLYQRLYAFYRQGIIFPSYEKPTEECCSGEENQVGEEACPRVILSHAKEFLAGQQYAEAEVLLNRVMEIEPTSDVRELLKEVESKLLEQLRADLHMPLAIPILNIPHNTLKEYPLTPQEKYLLSRIDGERELGAIVRVSPLKELDALKMVQCFIERSMVHLK